MQFDLAFYWFLDPADRHRDSRLSQSSVHRPRFVRSWFYYWHTEWLNWYKTDHSTNNNIVVVKNSLDFRFMYFIKFDYYFGHKLFLPFSLELWTFICYIYIYRTIGKFHFSIIFNLSFQGNFELKVQSSHCVL